MTGGPADQAGHVDIEKLAAAALDDLDSLQSSDPGVSDLSAGGLSDAERVHVASCSVCRYELDALRRVSALSLHSDRSVSDLHQPGAEVWTKISAAVATPAGLTPAADVGDRHKEPTPRHSRQSRPSRRPRGRVLAAVIAAVIGLSLGVGGTVVARRLNTPTSDVVASTSLAALPGEQGSGTAELVRVGNALDLRVAVEATAVPDRFYQLWLLDPAGDKMYDLGTLPTTGSATYPLPAELSQSLGRYTTVDVSIEPYDGNPAHSHHSLVRGQLPS